MATFALDELRAALARDELRMVYHAQVDMRTGRLAGVESLIRWQHPSRGLLHAVPFVDDMAAFGLAPEVMRWVLGTATRQLAAWRATELIVPRIAVNTWPVTVGREFRDDALRAVRDAGLEPADLEIEVQPETTFDAAAMAALRELRAAGLRVALDDFGDGDLRFTSLRDAQFDVVKIGVSFVLASQTAFDDAVLSAAVAFARAIGAVTVAEGVETTALRDRVRDLGVDLGQGFLWAQMVPGADFPAAVRAFGVDGVRGPASLTRRRSL
jgi:EAL domain-containing protein (putative c-di-GMP-specific phosphodiesterase class I)